MKIKSVTKEELETMPFDDIAYVILKENGKKMKINEIFKTICETLELGEEVFENQIGDFFALLCTEKRFLQLSNGYWDLRENHTSEVNINEIEDDIDEDVLHEEDLDEEEINDFYDDMDDMDDKEDDDLKGLVIVDENYDEEGDL